MAKIKASKQKESNPWLIVIGANTGGPQSLFSILPNLKSDFHGSIVVAQKMRRGFSRFLAGQLGQNCHMPVVEAGDGQELQISKIFVTPSSAYATISTMEMQGEYSKTFSVDCQQEMSIDELMESAAAVYGQNTIGILLSGLGNDGCQGMGKILEAGGKTIAQDDSSSAIFDLPSSAITAGYASHICPLWNISNTINEIMVGEVNAAAA